MSGVSATYLGNRVDEAALRQVLEFGGTQRDLNRRAQRVAAAARRLAPVRTGRVRRSVRVVKGRGYADITVGQVGRTPYLGYILNGTRPHEIRPRRAKALRFTVGGSVVFARRVQHPGTAPDRFLQKALLAARG